MYLNKYKMKKIFLSISIVAAAMLVLPGCDKQIDDAYANPNADVKVPIEQLLPGIISSMSGNSAGHGTLNDIRFVGKYVQNFLFCNANGDYDRMSGTRTTSDNAASVWRTHFYDIGQNCAKMIQWGAEEGKWDYVGVGKAIQAWSWLTLTDLHGDVINPAEALNTSALTFSYVTQDVIYSYVRQLCRESLENLSKTGDAVSPANLALGDAYFYNGDANKWKKFVYGVMARSFNHLTNKSSYNADSVIHYCNLSIATNAENASVKYASTGISGNTNFYGPLRGNLGSVSIGTETAIRQSAFIADLESGLNISFAGVVDPRAVYLLRKNAAGTFKGLSPNKGQNVLAPNDRPESFFGASQVSNTVNNATPGNDNNCRYLFRNNSETPIITAAEIQFMKAEAAYRKGDKATALAAYTLGISLNFDMLTSTYNTNVPPAEVITPAIKASFLANPLVVPATTADLNLSHIMLQKYIALYIHGAIETWVDMRRYHYDDFESGTNRQVYTGFVVPSGSDLYPDNNSKRVNRIRPRYNSEYVWNLNELRRIGADKLDYHTVECWFSQP
ncbi:SusD/RagB family nutrient-binding outer membrane lipoprotein [Ferruginibacter sp. HRS2-29]|nr:SusD/RagB family nutrient-binding outer membrane lipoprotein [Ferruginibacter sp. HRS2-29]